MIIKIDTSHSMRRNYLDTVGEQATGMVYLSCATMLIGAGLMSADDPIEQSQDFYNKLGRRGCLACPLVEKCSACFMCK